jgi:cytoskeletal protein RodZ
MNEDEKTGIQVQGPGRLLREERERKGLTHQDVAERTRLRVNIVQALEDEAWDKLPPSPAFVRGFLKNYAKVLSIDENRVLESYGRRIPVEANLLRIPGEPLRKPRKWPFFFFCMVGAVVVFAFWKIYEPRDTVPTLYQESKAPVVAAAEKTRPAPGPATDQEGTDQPAGVSAPAGLEKHEQQDGPAAEGASASVETVTEGGPHRLKGKVNSRTWVKIYVDDLNPREYIFQPGQQPEWTASQGFYLIIGNATGLDLEWNGRVVPALGSAGQVVRLRLPDQFRHRVEGN